MPPGIWVAALMILLPYVLVHFLLRRFIPKPARMVSAAAQRRTARPIEYETKSARLGKNH
jgi:hypothetical protein